MLLSGASLRLLTSVRVRPRADFGERRVQGKLIAP